MFSRQGLRQNCRGLGEAEAVKASNKARQNRGRGSQSQVKEKQIETEAWKLYKYVKLDGCIVWNAYNTIFGLNQSAIYAQAVYFLHSKMPKCHVPASEWCQHYLACYLFTVQACFSSMSVSQAEQRRTWFTQYWTVAKNGVGFFHGAYSPKEWFRILMVKTET